MTKLRFYVNGVNLDEAHGGLRVLTITPLLIQMKNGEPQATTDEEIIVKKMVDAITKFSNLERINVEGNTKPTLSYGPGGNFTVLKDYGHTTILFLTKEQFEDAGKLNAGDLLEISVKKIRERRMSSKKIEHPS